MMELDMEELVERLIGMLDENEGNLDDPSDGYAKGYHNALVDVLRALRVPVPAKHDFYFD